jgi:hypothetical protein
VQQKLVYAPARLEAFFSLNKALSYLRETMG